MALSFSAGSLSVVANNNYSKSSLSSYGFVTVAFPSGASKSPGPNSFTIKAENTTEGSKYSPYNYSYKPALIGTPPQIRTPWGHNCTEENIKMAFDMPGVEESELNVTITGDELSIDFNGPKDKKDAVGRTITGLYDTKIHLAPNCDTKKAVAEFKNGVLYVTIPRTSIERTVSFKVPFKNSTDTPTTEANAPTTEANSPMTEADTQNRLSF